MNGLRRPTRSDSQPEAMRRIEAVLSATPSIMPRLAIEAPSVTVTKIGSTGMIISLEMSVSSDTTPSAATLRVMPAKGLLTGPRAPRSDRAR
jgi:hypothetical protein